MEAAESQTWSIESDSQSGNVNYLEREYFDSPKRGGGRCCWYIDSREILKQIQSARQDWLLVGSAKSGAFRQSL